ncbi:hypothetical protein ACIQXR_13920 [Peribacillus sp. NPDC097224]|uniref:hypothetical protein n=1 Tax=Peribacillus sp. NPDC097224 TaxID=3364399 RepID=UPI003830D647
MIKKILTVFFVSVLFISIFLTETLNVQASELKENTVQAQNNDDIKIKFNNSERKKIIIDRENIISEIEEKTKTSSKSVNSIISQTLKENTQETLNKGIEKKLKTINHDLHKSIELETNIEPETFEINENLSVTFDDNFVIVDEFKESAEREVDENTDLNLFTFVDNLFVDKAYAATSKKKIKNASHSRSIYDTAIKSLKLVTAYIGAEFTYDGKKVTARRTGNYMKTENVAGILIDVVEKKSAIQKPSSSRRIAYQEGSAILGFTVKGHGLKLQEKYLRVNVESNAKGKITKNSILR